jgi:hemoglobin-like flavoprotein
MPLELDTLETSFAATELRRQEAHLRPEHYPVVGEVLIAAMAELAGDAWRPEYERAWGAAFDVVASVMFDGAAAADLETAA